MHDLNRRDFLALAAVPLLLPRDAPLQAQRGAPSPPPRLGSGLTVCMHEASSERFDFRAAMEGYAKAGVRYVEPNLVKVREFVDEGRRTGSGEKAARRSRSAAGLDEQPARADGAERRSG